MKKKQKLERARAKTSAQALKKASGEGGRTHTPTDDEKAFRRKQMLTTAKWNRYMLIRYLDAGLFFIGLYWLVMLFGFTNQLWTLLAPLVDFATGAVVILEVNRVLTHDIEYLKVSHMTLLASSAVTAAELVATALVGKDLFFPFFSSATVGMGFCALIIVLKLVIAWRIVLVRDRRDKKRYGLYVQQLELSSDSKGR